MGKMRDVVDLPNYDDVYECIRSDVRFDRTPFASARGATPMLWLDQSHDQATQFTADLDLMMRPQGHDLIGIAPRFYRVGEDAFGAVKIDHYHYLTWQGQLVRFPQSLASSKMQRALSLTEATTNPAVKLLGEYHLPTLTTRLHQNMDLDLVNLRCYGYQDGAYVHSHYETDQRDAWFRCEPVRVTPCADGSLQSNHILFAAPTGPALSNYLMRTLVADLQESTALNQYLAEAKKEQPIGVVSSGKTVPHKLHLLQNFKRQFTRHQEHDML